MSLQVRNPLVREKFASLAREEKAHREMLYNLLKRYTGEEKPPLPKKAPRISRSFEMNVPMPEIILGAIEKERQAIKFYRDAAEKSNDPTGKRILLYLALFEEGHERSLKIEYDAIVNYPQWFEFDAIDTPIVGS